MYRLFLCTLWAFSTTFGANAQSLGDAEKQQRIESMIAGFESDFKVPQVDVLAAQRLLSKQVDYVLLDVREPKETEVSMIPGAINKQEFEKNPEKYKDKKIIAYCTIGYRSSQYAEKWNQRGYHMSNLRGSLLLWSHAHGAMVDSAGLPTRQVHIYGKKWDLLANGYLGKY
jgi:rhodanese-related sulfurtransferase